MELEDSRPWANSTEVDTLLRSVDVQVLSVDFEERRSVDAAYEPLECRKSGSEVQFVDMTR